MNMNMKRINCGNKTLRAACLCSLLAMLIVLLPGCRKVEPVTADEFQAAMENMDYTISDITEDYAQYEYIQKCVGFEVDGLHVEFFEMDSKDSAVGFYNTNKADIESKKGTVNTESTVTMGSYRRYKLKTNDTYYIIEQAGTTAVYAYCPKADASKLDDVIDAINY